MGEPLEGRYANYFELGFTAFEVLLDFGQFDSESGDTLRHTRIITNPSSARVLLKMLSEIIDEFETKIGPVEAPED